MREKTTPTSERIAERIEGICIATSEQRRLTEVLDEATSSEVAVLANQLLALYCYPPVAWYSKSGDIPKRTGGLYILFDKNGVLEYVGQSLDVRRRVKSHRSRCWETIGVVPVRNTDARDVLEIALIGLLNPWRNIGWRTSLTKKRP